MNWKSALWKVAKAGIIMGTVGVLLAAVAPLIAMAVPGMLETSVTTYAEAAKALAPGISMTWTGLFFGAFGAIHAAVDPIESFLFKKTEETAKIVKEHVKEKTQELSHEIVRTGDDKNIKDISWQQRMNERKLQLSERPSPTLH